MVAGTQKAIAAAVAPLIARAEAAEARTLELETRLASIEARDPIPGPQGPAGPAGERGADGVGMAGGFVNKDGVLVITRTDGSTVETSNVVGKDGRDGADGKDGASVTVAEVMEAAAPLIREEVAGQVASAIAAIPAPKDGEPGPEGPMGPQGERGERGHDGMPADPVEVAKALEPFVAQEVAVAAAALPVPQDGKDGASVTVEDVAPLIASEVQKAVAALPPPKPGAPGADGMDGRSVEPEEIRQLIAKELETFPAPRDGIDGKDADMEEVGRIVAERVKDAVASIPVPQDGRDGKDADPEYIKQLVTDAVAAIPPPKDGDPGRDCDMVEVERILSERVKAAVESLPPAKDGRDGFGFEDFSLEFDGERTFAWVFERNGERKEFICKAPIVLDRGTYRDGKSYETGDMVSFGGSAFIAQRDTTDKPESSDAWRLAVKRGRDGKPGKDAS
jgi:hypothetical protein